MTGIAELFSARPQVVGDGRYQLQGRLGTGGVAEVFLAIDTKHDTKCAVKIMEVQSGARKEIATRFLAEAKVLSELRHPHIPRVHKVGSQDGWYWFAMDLAEGGSLAQELRSKGPIHPERALRLTFEVLSALAAVHATGLVHRDVKPANVLLDANDHALLADFGIVRHPEGSMPMKTIPGQLMGTQGYRSPEQEDDAHNVESTTDLYGVSATLYALVTGRAPRRLWQDPSFAAMPEVVAEVIQRSSSLERNGRYPDARAMADAVAIAADVLAAERGAPPNRKRWMAAFDEALPRAGWRESLRTMLPSWLGANR